MATFVSMMPTQPGRSERAFVPAQPYPVNLRKTIGEWSLQIDSNLGRNPRKLRSEPSPAEMRPHTDVAPQAGAAAVEFPRLEAEPAPEPVAVPRKKVAPEPIPPFHPRWVSSPAPQPAARMMFASSALAQASTPAPRLGTLIEMPLGRRGFERSAVCAAPAASPVERMVRPAMALRAIQPVPVLRGAALVQVRKWTKTLKAAGAVASPTASPLERMVRPATALHAIESMPVLRGAALPQPLDWTKSLPVAGVVASPEAEPAERLVLPATALHAIESMPTLRGAAFLDLRDWTETMPVAGTVASPDAEPDTPPSAGVVASPDAEPAERIVLPATALLAIESMPALRGAAFLELSNWTKTLLPAGPVASPQAEPAERMVLPAAALAPLEMASAAYRAPVFALAVDPLSSIGAGLAPAMAAEPAERFLQVAYGLTPAVCASHQPRLQLPQIAAELDPLPVPDEPPVIPAICLRSMPAPAAEPLCRMVHSTHAAFLTAALPVALPASGWEAVLPYLPFVNAWIAMAAPEPVMSGVAPRTASLPVAPIPLVATLSLPEIPSLAQELLSIGAPVAAPAAEPVETLAMAAGAAVPAQSAAECRVPAAAALALTGAAPALAGPAAGLMPQALESMMRPSSADPLNLQARMQVLAFTIEANGDLAAPGFNALGLAPEASKPKPAGAHPIALRPMNTLQVKPPAQRHARFLPALPHPGMLPVEFHAQRSRGALYERPDWKTSRLPAQPPKFALRPIFGKLEEATPMPKPSKQEPEFVKTFSNPARRPSKLFVIGGQIAAGILLASSLWYAYTFRGRMEVAGSAPAAMQSSGSSDVAGIAPSARAAAASGPVTWVRQSLARRASVEVTDHFRDGMAGWGTKGAANPPGWTHHPDGYIVPSALAFFRPSMNFKDYRFEFYGQIENKGMSWSVRAKDANNYHAMRVAVVEAGLRPFVALVHWDVIDGKAGKASRTPLNIMVHNDRPMQVAVEVEGNRLVTSIDGEEVDTLTNLKLAAGGVGFFADANERARLYWMRVSKNDDWLGRVCGFLAGDEAMRATAEFRGPRFPGESPVPGFPGQDNLTQAAVWAALPYLRAAQKARASNKTRRTERWNT